MKIKLIELSGLCSALEAVRLPYNGIQRSTTSFDMEPSIINTNDNGSLNSLTTSTSCIIDNRDLELLHTLKNRGDEHAKVLRGIIVYTKIEAPIHWWSEAETYRMGHERLCSASTMHTEGRGLSGEALAEALHKVPFDRPIVKVDYWSYQCLRNIYLQRRNHRKQEWQEFCDWIETLPYAKILILPDEKVSNN